MRVPFTGKLQQPSRALCRGDDKPRRDDGLRPTYGSANPALSSAEVDAYGIASANASVAYAKASTTEGDVLLPQEHDTMQYLPSASTLEFLTHAQSTRLQPLPARYFP